MVDSLDVYPVGGIIGNESTRTWRGFYFCGVPGIVVKLLGFASNIVIQ